MRASSPVGRIFPRIPALAIPFLAATSLAGGQVRQPEGPLPTLASMREGFAHPPLAARLRCYWWWLNGHTDEATITNDLEQMKSRGFGGALLIDANGADQNGNRPVPAGPTFGSPAWVNLYTHALREADRLGLEITLNITSGWNLGGPDVSPEQAAKILTWSRTAVEGDRQVHVVLPPPAARNGYYRPIAVLAYPLARGEALAPQPDDIQEDRHTGRDGVQPAARAERDAAATRRECARALAFRRAAAETGFSMPDASAMLDAGMHNLDASYSDTPASAVLDL